MDINMHIARRLALLPDESLMQVLQAMKDTGGKENAGRETPRSERLDDINRELHARGLFAPPWWSVSRR